MTTTVLTGWFLIIANIAFSYYGLTNNSFFDGYKFDVDRILIDKDYKRLITSGFLHVSWPHLILNMLALNAFADAIEIYLGSFQLLLLYFVSLLGGNLLALYIHRNHGDYTAAGASGAIAGLIFASIALFPGIEIGILGLHIPGWIYGFLYCIISIYGIKSNYGNIGHEAHLGGALLGVVSAIAFDPTILEFNYPAIATISIPTIVFLLLIVIRPDILLVETFSLKASKNNYQTIDDKYNELKIQRQKELDKILDKINKNGIDSLSKTEKEKLEEYSN